MQDIICDKYTMMLVRDFNIGPRHSEMAPS